MITKPYILIEWRDTESDAVGWLCIYNFVHHYSGGGIRMHPCLTKELVLQLARVMAYKYKASEPVRAGGCKGGIRYNPSAPEAKSVLKRYLTAISPYLKAGVSLGGDLGVNYYDVLEMFDALGIGIPQTRAMKADAAIQRGIAKHDALSETTLDGFKLYDMPTGYGVAYSADEFWKLSGNKAEGASVIIQGFGCVGAGAAKCLEKSGYRVCGIADEEYFIYRRNGLNVDRLISSVKKRGRLNPESFANDYEVDGTSAWLGKKCDILIPAADSYTITKTNAESVKARLICEGANLPVTPEADFILKRRGIGLVPDFIANIGAVRVYNAIIFGE